MLCEVIPFEYASVSCFIPKFYRFLLFWGKLLLALAQNHIEGVATAAVELARHRRSDIVEVQDLQLCLGKDWDMPWLGVGNPARSGSRNEVKSSRTKLNAAVAADRVRERFHSLSPAF